MKSMQQQLVEVVREIVSDESRACDSETGFCRFCSALLESEKAAEVEPHRDNCPWYRARALVEIWDELPKHQLKPEAARHSKVRRHHLRAA